MVVPLIAALGLGAGFVWSTAQLIKPMNIVLAAVTFVAVSTYLRYRFDAVFTGLLGEQGGRLAQYGIAAAAGYLVFRYLGVILLAGFTGGLLTGGVLWYVVGSAGLLVALELGLAFFDE